MLVGDLYDLANTDKILFAESINGVITTSSNKKHKVLPRKKERAINPQEL